MSKFERVLSDEWLPLEFKSGNDVPVTSLMVNLKTLKSIVEQAEQAVLEKLAEQEPVMYARTHYGEIDWDEACVTEKNDGMLMHATDMRKEDFIRHGYAIIPLYTHPFASPMNSKTFCVSENEKCDTQTGGQVKMKNLKETKNGTK